MLIRLFTGIGSVPITSHCGGCGTVQPGLVQLNESWLYPGRSTAELEGRHGELHYCTHDPFHYWYTTKVLVPLSQTYFRQLIVAFILRQLGALQV
jgi:hypothetical protein